MLETKTAAKQRILQASGEVFAEAGFRRATVRDICSRAGVNIASVNYYFQDKGNLYVETLRYWKDIAFEKYPRELGTSESDPPEERLKGFIRSFVFRILDTGVESRFGRLMAREFAEPTAALDVIVEEVARPMFHLLSAIVGRIIGQDPASNTSLYCCASVVGQCLYFLYARPVLHRLVGEDKVRSMDIEDIAGHICGFSLAALAAISQDRDGVS